MRKLRYREGHFIRDRVRCRNVALREAGSQGMAGGDGDRSWEGL